METKTSPMTTTTQFRELRRRWNAQTQRLNDLIEYAQMEYIPSEARPKFLLRSAMPVMGPGSLGLSTVAAELYLRPEDSPRIVGWLNERTTIANYNPNETFFRLLRSNSAMFGFEAYITPTLTFSNNESNYGSSQAGCEPMALRDIKTGVYTVLLTSDVFNALAETARHTGSIPLIASATKITG